jgi:GT2 family glycosyltransferase
MNDGLTSSLVICTYRRAEQVRRLLAALSEQTRIPDEIVVVDASPDDETRQVVLGSTNEVFSGRLHYHHPPLESRGLTRQRNYGIEHSTGAIVAFLDDDTVPEPEYFAEVLACFARRPDAIGVGGYIANETTWWPADQASSRSLALYRRDGWARREDFRWRLRRVLGLASPYPPGWMPPSGHGRPVSFLPPDGREYCVEFVMGGVSAWRRQVFETHKFSRYFEGYGLYEDLDFCVRAGRDAPLYLTTRARVAHHHAPSGRPNPFRYGVMVVRNGWYVWRVRWPSPSLPDRARWWATTLLLTSCQAIDGLSGRSFRRSLTEAAGRTWGALTLLWSLPGELPARLDPRTRRPGDAIHTLPTSIDR